KQYGRGTEDAAIAASKAAAEVTVNFRRAGYYGQILNQMIAFWNPAIQGMSKFGRTFQEKPIKTAMWAAGSIMGPALALWALHKDERWYQELPRWEKALFLHFKVGERIVRIPMPMEFGMIFGALPVATAQSLYENNPEAAQKMGGQILDNMTPPIVP